LGFGCKPGRDVFAFLSADDTCLFHGTEQVEQSQIIDVTIHKNSPLVEMIEFWRRRQAADRRLRIYGSLIDLLLFFAYPGA
jgi:hypothetical protein